MMARRKDRPADGPAEDLSVHELIDGPTRDLSGLVVTPDAVQELATHDLSVHATQDLSGIAPTGGETPAPAGQVTTAPRSARRIGRWSTSPGCRRPGRSTAGPCSARCRGWAAGGVTPCPQSS
ncbi:hypothetical protein [Micromonospora sp. ATA51]|uniref:hypothetical protein n=1 Tax=Micromonospora sp. ATA51 TaxID=2806098 RepID=UPI001A43EE3A|nr:hypothetical protein [Micromonospora sp. ATA51]MBM0226035.1 hypothetical protein [Micromonospora sp. ATA51]